TFVSERRLLTDPTVLSLEYPSTAPVASQRRSRSYEVLSGISPRVPEVSSAGARDAQRAAPNRAEGANSIPGEEPTRGRWPATIPIWGRSVVSVSERWSRLGQVASEFADGIRRQEDNAPRMTPSAAISDLKAMLVHEVLDPLDGA